ncbi:hypothetical protein [Cryptosporangium aurantiacum]|uniref:Uncharacterized protein n=1 Tax=Cryptosporangium aurantiacum TaxID=134849 RepID=A0A1M7RKS4_9ACTN|nr:hypothetical protein [Cryptosporangium aurantiacum]SHN46913.1 hypothetical protein SAMN05443668_1198 [Cryptosporangium aurantiacum]
MTVAFIVHDDEVNCARLVGWQDVADRSKFGHANRTNPDSLALLEHVAPLCLRYANFGTLQSRVRRRMDHRGRTALCVGSLLSRAVLSSSRSRACTRPTLALAVADKRTDLAAALHGTSRG